MERNGSVIEQLISITGKDRLFKVPNIMLLPDPSIMQCKQSSWK